jgi:DNA replication and repair protein RecF
MFNEGKPFDGTALDTYDQQLIKAGEILFSCRDQFMIEFIPIFRKYYDFLVEERELADIEYTSGLQVSSFLEGLQKSRGKDLALGRTTFGVHRDDFTFLLKTFEIKKRGSQGQQKSFLIALRLAQREVISNHKGFSPILLMDDIFDKLDDFRIGWLLDLIHQGLGQFFITDARPDRTQGLLDRINVSATSFVVENGKVNTR